MRERQICRKCGTVFSEREFNGPDYIVKSMRIMETMCPKCGGSATWSDVDESRISDFPGGGIVSKISFCLVWAIGFAVFGAWIGYHLFGKMGSHIFSWIGLIFGGVLSAWLSFFKFRV